MGFREFIDFYFFGRHRLESIPLLPLGSTVTNAIALYGQPNESRPTKETPDIAQLIFSPSPYHEVQVLEWKSAIQSIVFRSVKGDPKRDLKYVLTHYQRTAALGASWKKGTCINGQMGQPGSGVARHR